MLSFQGGIRVPSYTAAKSGLAGLTRALANEWAAKGINVNAIAPGYMATDNTAPLRADLVDRVDVQPDVVRHDQVARDRPRRLNRRNPATAARHRPATRTGFSQPISA